MLLARILDEKFASLYRAGKIHGGVFLGRGQEALSVATGLAWTEAGGDVLYVEATLLPSGTVLVAGGTSDGDASLSDAEIFNPKTGAWTGPPSLVQFRNVYIKELK